MLVSVCSAYIKVLICVLAGGSMGKKGEVKCAGGCGVALVLACFRAWFRLKPEK